MTPIEKLHDVAPFGGTAGSDIIVEIFRIFSREIFIFAFFCFSPMIVARTENDRRTVVGFCELSCHESDESVFERGVCIIEDRRIRISFSKSFFREILDNRLSFGIEDFNLFEKIVCTGVSCKKPTECSHRSVHSTTCIYARPDAESDEFGIVLDFFFGIFRELSESARDALFHLSESEFRDDAVFRDERHAVRDGSEGCEVDVFLENFFDFFRV